MDTIYSTTLHGGSMWSKIIGRGKTLRLTDIEGKANVGMLLYNALEKQERYNMPDTLKGQHIFYLTAPYCLHSDMGRLFCSITEDTAGWHDTVCGCSDAELVTQKYGSKTFQEGRNECYKDARGSFLIELAKWGLGKRDLVPNINWFSKVTSDTAGQLSYQPRAVEPGSHVDLRFEMDTLVVLNTCQHPLDPNPRYAPGEVRLEVFSAQARPTQEDPCFQVRPENRWAFENTEIYHQLRF
ncbi:MAG: urea amidolyase associated protein UAAP1 [Opitutales bacterium]